MITDWGVTIITLGVLGIIILDTIVTIIIIMVRVDRITMETATTTTTITMVEIRWMDQRVTIILDIRVTRTIAKHRYLLTERQRIIERKENIFIRF